MRNKLWIVILFLIFFWIGLIVLVFSGCSKNQTPQTKIIYDTVKVYIDSLQIKDSTIFNYRDSLRFIDSLRITDSVKILDLNKLLFTHTADSSFIDSTIHYSLTKFESDTLKTFYKNSKFDLTKTNYYFDLKFYFDSSLSAENNLIQFEKVYYRNKDSVRIVSLPYSFNTNGSDLKGYLKFDLGSVYRVDSIKVLTGNEGVSLPFWLSETDTSKQGAEKYFLDGETILNKTYIPQKKKIRWINISTEGKHLWNIFSIKIYGK